MALWIQKFGGTSVKDLDRIRAVAEIVIEARQAGHQVVVVVSAMAGETDRLIQLAKAIMPSADPEEYDALVSTGELVTSALVSLALQERGFAAHSFSGNQVRIRTNDHYKRSRIEEIETDNLCKSLSKGIIPVVAGFQGVSAGGRVTTFGRGGSDVTAVALAAALKADECQIYTDVDGVYTTDPRIVPEARRLERVTFEEMLELASLGAKVLQIRSVEFAGRYKVPVRVLSSYEKGPGTLITLEDKQMEQPMVSGVAFDRHQAKITLRGIPDQPGLASKILTPISEAGVEVDMIVQNLPNQDTMLDLSFTLHRDDYKVASDIAQKLALSLGAKEVVGSEKIAKLSVVGVGMRSHAGVAATMFQALAKEGIHIHLISTSEIKISVVIDERYIELGARALHAVFRLDEPPVLMKKVETIT